MSEVSAECRVRSSERKARISGLTFIPRSAFRAPQSKGFTLIEVLLALAILAVIVTVVYQSFSSAGQSVQQAEEVRDGTDLARTLMARLTTDLANAYVNRGISEPTFFYGRKAEDEDTKERTDAVYLTTLTDPISRTHDSKETELWEVGYYFLDRPEDKKRVLMRHEKRELSKDIPAMEGGVEYELTDEVKAMKIRYTLDGSTWRDEWDTKSQFQMPKAVDIILSLADGRVYATRVDMRGQYQ